MPFSIIAVKLRLVTKPPKINKKTQNRRSEKFTTSFS